MNDEQVEELKVEELKKEINNLIWMHGDANLTLKAAESRACDILCIIRSEPTDGEKMKSD